MTILRSLIRTYIIEYAMNTAFEKIWYNFMVPPEAKRRWGTSPITISDILMRFREVQSMAGHHVIIPKDFMDHDFKWELKL